MQKNTARTQPMMIGVFTFMIAMVFMASQASAQDLTSQGLFNTFTQGEGDAYSNMLLNQIFGPIYNPTGGSGVAAGGTTIFASIVGYFNAAMLVIAGLLFFNNLVTGTVQSAHEGEVMGRNWSSLWAPLRTIMAVALLIPLPNYNGYNTAQVFVAFISKNATNFASSVWSISAERIVTGVMPVSAPTGSIPQGLASQMFLLEMCKVILDDQFASSATSDGQNRIVRTSRVIQDTIGNKDLSKGYRTVVTYDRVNAQNEITHVSLCGSYTTPNMPAVITNRVDPATTSTFSLADSMSNVSNVRTTFTRLHADVMNGLSSAMYTIARNTYANHKQVLDDSTSGSTPMIDISPNLQQALLAANNRLNQGYQDLSANISASGNRNDAVRQAMVNRISTVCDTSGVADNKKVCMGEGWIGAGSWYMMVARINAELSSLYSAEGTATASGSARSEIKDPERNLLFWTTESEKNLRKQYNDAFTYGARVFNTAANQMAAVGWPIDTALVNNISASLGGTEVDEAFETNTAKSSYNKHISGVIALLNDVTFGNDPMISMVSIGQSLTEWGSFLIISDIFLPGNIASTVGGVIATAGATMAIILPLMPFLFWIMAVTGYFLLIVEAFLAVNLWAISHLKMDGEGISGGAGREGWLMLLSLMVTPFLMVAGYLVGMVIFRISAALISSGFLAAFSGLLGNSNMFFTTIASMVVMVFMVFFYLIIIERSFSLVSEFPSKVLRWMGAAANLDTNGADRVRASALGAMKTTHDLSQGLTKNINIGPWPRAGSATVTKSGAGGTASSG